MDGPEHACAILTDARGRLLIQLRPPWVRHAAEQLTCFGGKREAGESAEVCLRRELAEELNWTPEVCTVAVDLVQGPRWIARFFHGEVSSAEVFRCEPGFSAVWSPPVALPGLPVSPWHARVLAAWQAGITRVDLSA